MSLESSYQHHPWHIEHHTLNIVMPPDPQLERDFLEVFGFGSTGGGGGGGAGGEAGAVASSAILSYRSGLAPEGGGVLSSVGEASLLTMGSLLGGRVGVRGAMRGGLSMGGGGSIGSDFMMAGGSGGGSGGFGGSSSSSASAPSRNWAKPHELLAMQRQRRLQAPHAHVGGTDGTNGFEGLLPSARWIECGMPLHLPTEWSVPQAPPLVPPPPPPAAASSFSSPPAFYETHTLHGAPHRMDRNRGGLDEDPFEHVLRGAPSRT